MCARNIIFRKLHSRKWVLFFFNFYLFMIVTERERERAETQAEGEAGSMHREPDVGFDPGSPGSRPGPRAGTKPLHPPGIPQLYFNKNCLKYIRSIINSI